MRGIEEFAENIREYGIIQPITVRPKGDKFEIVIGERRVRAAIMAGLREVKAQVKQIDDATADELRLVENIHRDDLTEAEKGDAILSLLENRYDKYPSFKAIADKLKVNYWTMTTHWLPKARRASPYLKHLISGDRVLESQVLALLKYKPHIQDFLVPKIMEHALNREQTIKFLKLYDERGNDNLDSLAKEAKGIQKISLFVDELPPEIAQAVTDVVSQKEKPIPPPMVGESKARMLDSLRDTMERKKKGREKAQGELREITPSFDDTTVKLASSHTEIAEQLTKRVQEQIEDAISKAPERADRIVDIVDEEIGGLRKRLEIFPEKSQKIQPKFERFQALLERGVIPYTIWDFPYRDDYAGDKDFHGNCSPQIVEQCIWRLTEEGDLVVDPMAGSGTALDVCRAFNRRCIGYDIKPPANREDIIQNDSRNIPLEDSSVDMVFIHPPYWNLVYFTKAEEKLPDLSRAATAEQFIELLREAFQECHRILKTGKFMCVLLGDLIRDGSFIPLCRKATNMAKELGFIDYGYAVKLAHGEVSRKKSGVIVAEPLYTDNLKISHDLIIFFKKG
jgi:SAM-dependent methyltransferase